MLNAHTVLDYLATDPCARRLSALVAHEPTAVTTWLDTLDCGAALAAVPVAEGLLVLPVTGIDPDHGWERYDITQAAVIDTPADWVAATAAFQTLRERLTTLVGTARPCEVA